MGLMHPNRKASFLSGKWLFSVPLYLSINSRQSVWVIST